MENGTQGDPFYGSDERDLEKDSVPRWLLGIAVERMNFQDRRAVKRVLRKYCSR